MKTCSDKGPFILPISLQLLNKCDFLLFMDVNEETSYECLGKEVCTQHICCYFHSFPSIKRRKSPKNRSKIAFRDLTGLSREAW